MAKRSGSIRACRDASKLVAKRSAGDRKGYIPAPKPCIRYSVADHREASYRGIGDRAHTTSLPPHRWTGGHFSGKHALDYKGEPTGEWKNYKPDRTTKYDRGKHKAKVI